MPRHAELMPELTEKVLAEEIRHGSMQWRPMAMVIREIGSTLPMYAKALADAVREAVSRGVGHVDTVASASWSPWLEPRSPPSLPTLETTRVRFRNGHWRAWRAREGEGPREAAYQWETLPPELDSGLSDYLRPSADGRALESDPVPEECTASFEKPDASLEWLESPDSDRKAALAGFGP